MPTKSVPRSCNGNGLPVYAVHRPKGYLPFFRLLFRDLFAFRRQGYSWRMAWSAARDYWRFDRAL